MKIQNFDTIEVIKSKSQALLNTLSEHDFQGALKERADILGMVQTCERGLL
jgi:hypothetical protein